jgi:hypothetical protein
MSAATKGRTISALRAGAAIFSIFATVTILLRFPPESYSFYPRCPIFTLFHIQCPGCGATRALAAILRGHPNEALRLNPLFTLALPGIILWTALYRRNPAHWTQPPRQALYAALAITVAFTIARNL